MKHPDLRKFFCRISFYISHFTLYFLPKPLLRVRARRAMRRLTPDEKMQVKSRTDYYVKFASTRLLPSSVHPGDDSTPTVVKLEDYKYPWRKKHQYSTYFLDLYRVVGSFPGHLKMAYLFGDVTSEFDFPVFTKTRPIKEESNSVILKLNSVRHFQWVEDSLAFSDKKDMAVSRNYVRHQPHRALLLQKYLNHPLCDFGMVNTDDYQEHPEWVKGFLTKKEMLQYKFIMAIEGNDVATNLKWVMSSNSVAVMPKPKYESWFMEGTLIPDYHYIQIADDYSDLEERLHYYISHPDEAETIIKNAHEYVKSFCNRKVEFATQISVAESYFRQTGQIK